MDGAKVYPLPARDPVTGGALVITELQGPESGVTLRGRFEMPRFAQLSPDQARYLETFLRCRGMLNSVERELGISYPTARARLDAVLKALDLHAVREDGPVSNGAPDTAYASPEPEPEADLVPDFEAESAAVESDWGVPEEGERVFEQPAFDEPLETPEPMGDAPVEEPQVASAPRRTRNEILTLLERGEITPEEAKRELAQ
jgi:hypothetical protein